MAQTEIEDRPPKRMFVAVVIVEAVVLAGLWFLGRYFS